LSKQNTAIAIFLTTFGAVILASKYEKELSFNVYLIQLMILSTLYMSLNAIDFDLIPKFISPKVLFIALALYHMISILLTRLKIVEPYLFWSKFGFNSMYLNNDLFIFGDLAHLTSWASCNSPIEIGSAECDPFSRSTNQNPHVLSLFRYFDLSNLFVIGLILVCAFYISIYKLFNHNNSLNSKILILCISPTVVMALERNNEILTIILITLGLRLTNQQGLKQILGSLMLVTAVFFKFWPILVVGVILFLNWKVLTLISKLCLVLGLFYWLVYFNNFLSMRTFTQNGSYLGGSFGFQLFFVDRKSYIWLYLLLAVMVIYTTLFRKGINEFKASSSKSLTTLVPLFLSYVILWLIGVNWSYRLIILLPTLYFLENCDLPEKFIKKTSNLIVITMLTSQLSVTIFITSFLSFYLGIFIVHNLGLMKKDLLDKN
jgi:hypothetical protein